VGEEKYRICRTWRDFHKPQAVPLFYRRDGTVLLTEQVDQLLASCSKGGTYLYVMELSAENLHLPLYIGKSNAPSSRWRGGHVRQLNTAPKGSYVSWRRTLSELSDPINLYVLHETDIRQPPLAGFPCSVGAVEYQLVSLASDFCVVLLNSEGKAR
jgi:hypothetical protein